VTETQIKDFVTSHGNSLTGHLVASGAPQLPEGFTYRLDIKHPTLTDGRPAQAASVTARIGSMVASEWVEVSRFTEVTRASLQGATVAACVHAYEVWGA
jgi:hypothetical protein